MPQIFLKKVGEKLGDVDMGAPPQTTAARSAGPPPPPEINTLLDAARYLFHRRITGRESHDI